MRFVEPVAVDADKAHSSDRLSKREIRGMEVSGTTAMGQAMYAVYNRIRARLGGLQVERVETL